MGKLLFNVLLARALYRGVRAGFRKPPPRNMAMYARLLEELYTKEVSILLNAHNRMLYTDDLGPSAVWTLEDHRSS